jgi:hypothetical protein
MVDLAEDSGQDNDRMLDRKVEEFLQEDGYNVMVTVKFEHFEQHLAPCIITCLINYVKLMNIKYRLITCLTFKEYG